MHECNAHFCILSIFSLTSWDVTVTKGSTTTIGQVCLPITFGTRDHGCQYPDTYLSILRFYDTTVVKRYVS
jgi:hypothetical protein